MTAPPMTDKEIQSRYKDGDTVQQIAAAARRRNGMSVPQVRAIIFGKDAS